MNLYDLPNEVQAPPGSVDRVIVATRERGLATVQYEALGTTRTPGLDLVKAAHEATVATWSPRVQAAIRWFWDAERPGALLVRNVPVDETIPPTPITAAGADRVDLPVATACLLGASSIAGEPFSYRSEWGGALITHVLPTKKDSDTASSRGSRVTLPLHTEVVHFGPRWSPSGLVLLCVRGDRSARTLLAAARDIVTSLPHETVDVLREPLFWVKAPRSFGDNTMTGGPMAVLSGPSDAPQIAAEFMDMGSISAIGARALEELKETAGECMFGVALETGDMLFIDNRKMLHGRNRYSARLDGTDRWCLRVMLRSGALWSWRTQLAAPRQLAF